jgi:DNA-binding transcriptional ArsR family regulator
MSDRDTKTIGDTMEDTKERHRRYIRAVNHPLRRRILKAIKEGYDTMQSLEESLHVDAKTLDWHLRLLEYGYCVERIDDTRFTLTQDGLVVDHVEG